MDPPWPRPADIVTGVSPDVQISRGNATQIDQLRPAFLALHDHHREVSAVALTEPDEREWTERASTYAECFSTGRALLHLATQHEQCVGYALTVVHDSNDDTFPLAPRYAELYTLAVLPDWRGCGVGSRLMDAVESEVQKNDQFCRRSMACCGRYAKTPLACCEHSPLVRELLKNLRADGAQ
jgi:ribosomal protein S18 acetylase RimI-like enzyme